MRLNLVLLMLFSSLLLACSAQPDKQGTDSREIVMADLLIFSEQTMDGGTAEVRLLFSDHFLRVDDSRFAKGDYQLFDFEQHKLFKIDHSGQTIKVVDRAPLPAAPVNLEWQIVSSPSQALIRSSDREKVKSMHYKFMLNGQACYDIVVLQGRLDVARALLQGYRELIAGTGPLESQASLCDNAVNRYQPAQVMQFGFPIREWNSTGYRRFLTDFRPGLQVTGKWFSLPEGYNLMPAGDSD